MTRKQMALTLTVTAVFAFLGAVAAAGMFHNSVSAQTQLSFTQQEYTLPEGQFIGTVEKGKFIMLVPRPAFPVVVRLTGISMQEARPAESAEVDLVPYEGKVIFISGHDGGSWIYQADILDSGGPLLKALVQKAFNP